MIPCERRHLAAGVNSTAGLDLLQLTMSDHTKTNIVTLTGHVIKSQFQHKDATGDLSLLLAAIQVGCKFVESCVRKASLIYL